MKLIIKKIVIVCLCLTLFLSIASPAFAAWAPSSIRYASPTYITYKHRSSSTNTAVTTAFNNARTDWTNAVSGLSIVSNSNSANEVYAVNITGDGIRGETIWRGTMYKGSSNGYNYNYYSYFDIYINIAYSAGTYAYRSTSGHEIGHLLGLDHTSGNVLMNTSRNHESIWKPQSDDITGVKTMHRL